MKKISALLIVALLASTALLIAQNGPASNAGDSQSVIAFLNQAIVWYRQLNNQQQLANEPSDILFVNDNRQIADEVLRMSFDYARARAQELSSSVASSGAQKPADQNSSSARYSALTNSAVKADQQVKQLQTEIEQLKRQRETAPARKRGALDSAVAESQSELELAQTRRDALRNLASFASTTGENGVQSGNLQSEIEELARTVPSAVGATQSTGTESSGTQSKPTQVQMTSADHKGQPAGILGLIGDLMTLRRKMNAIHRDAQMTDDLSQTAKDLRAPLLAKLKTLVAQGNQITNAPDSTDPNVLEQQKQQLDSLTAQFKQVSASMLPLGKSLILLDVYSRSLGNWHNAVESQYSAELKSLILRLAILAVVILVILGAAEIWRRAIFRYVKDIRRRHQFLLLRRIVVWVVISIILALAFATELGSLATFAGLMTAGVAVALQNVILSVAGYFFLIGKYGIRVGDRVQIGDVTGDVIDVGLVRLHIMEVGTGTGTDARPTGRVVVFSNSVVFQANSGLFKQIPGTSFGWHEISLTLAPNSNYHDVEDRLLRAVHRVFADYKEAMESQRRRMEQSISFGSIRSLEPETRLRLTTNGLEVVIRYPVEISTASAIDDKMARALLDAINQEPRFRLVGTGTPNIQAIEQAASHVS